jgi:uncharacterized protein
MKQNSVSWFEIYVDDMDRAKTFYEAVFSVALSPLPMPDGSGGTQMLAFPMQQDTPGASGALVQMEGYGPASHGTIIYFSCEDCAVEESRVVDAGGDVVRSKESIGQYGFMALIKDTEGNTIGLHSMK